jgi:hypothetical protein
VAETMGTLIDKICISELKRYHMQEQVDRTDVSEEHRAQCRGKFVIIEEQRNDLVAEYNALVDSWTRGTYKPKVYRQFKMYNDPRFQVKPRA